MNSEGKKVGGDGKGLFPIWFSIPINTLIFGSILLMVAMFFILAIIVNIIGFGLWAVVNHNRAPAKFQEVKLTLEDLWENTKDRLRIWRW